MVWATADDKKGITPMKTIKRKGKEFDIPILSGSADPTGSLARRMNRGVREAVDLGLLTGLEARAHLPNLTAKFPAAKPGDWLCNFELGKIALGIDEASMLKPTFAMLSAFSQLAMDYR